MGSPAALHIYASRGWLMNVRKVTGVGLALAAAGTLLSPSAAVAATAAHCDAYSHHCTHVLGHKIVVVPTVGKCEKTTTLPFTGAEIVLMTVAGGGALGAGTVLVVGARRRRHAAPA
jgi:hypothetical protein